MSFCPIASCTLRKNTFDEFVESLFCNVDDVLDIVCCRTELGVYIVTGGDCSFAWRIFHFNTVDSGAIWALAFDFRFHF